MQAVLDPLGMPLATDVVSGNRADDPLSGPGLERVQASGGRRGVLYVGDGKMASRETRAWIVHQGADSLCPLPHVPLAEGELEAALEALDRGEVALRPVGREPQDDESERIAEGYERQVVRAFEAQGARQTWMERHFVVRSLRHAKAADVSLRVRVAKAHTQVAALHQHGRGRQRFEKRDELRHAATAIVQRHHVEEFLWLRDDQQCTSRPVRAYRNREAGIRAERQATVEVRVDKEALERAVGRLGWRVYVTNQPSEQWSLEQAILAYRCRSCRCTYSEMIMPPG